MFQLVITVPFWQMVFVLTSANIVKLKVCSLKVQCAGLMNKSINLYLFSTLYSCRLVQFNVPHNLL